MSSKWVKEVMKDYGFTGTLTLTTGRQLIRANAINKNIALTLEQFDAFTDIGTMTIFKSDTSANTVTIKLYAGDTWNGVTDDIVLSDVGDAVVISKGATEFKVDARTVFVR
jgi:hypothetical protein